MNIKTYEDKFISDNITFYYPKITIESYKSNTKFKKAITLFGEKYGQEIVQNNTD
jgi:hypothetical protein